MAVVIAGVQPGGMSRAAFGVGREPGARVPLGLNDSRDWPQLLRQAAAIANKNAAVRVVPRTGYLSLLLPCSHVA